MKDRRKKKGKLAKAFKMRNLIIAAAAIGFFISRRFILEPKKPHDNRYDGYF